MNLQCPACGHAEMVRRPHGRPPRTDWESCARCGKDGYQAKRGRSPMRYWAGAWGLDAEVCKACASTLSHRAAKGYREGYCKKGYGPHVLAEVGRRKDTACLGCVAIYVRPRKPDNLSARRRRRTVAA